MTQQTTETTTFTAGPWRVEDDDENEQPFIVTDGGSLVAKALHECVRPRPEIDANAHLIASAPDLYEALQHATKAIESLPIDALGEAGTDDTSWPLRDELLHQMRSALAKAEGRERPT